MKSIELKKVAPGWLKRALENASKYEKENRVWVDRVRDNWKKDVD